MSTSKAAKACAILQTVAMVKDHDHALKIYDALGRSFSAIDKVLKRHETVRWRAYNDMDDDEYWEIIENFALAIDAAREHFGEDK